ncbi:MAG: Holliday junction resolvase RecU [Bacilli bacterium]|nr:Holliday junction resolvase RecU [Bacilli bacterium]
MRYPKGVKKQYEKLVSYSNRGMCLENDINCSNEFYLINDIAVIYKKPTPITVNKVDYKGRNDAVIKEAHYITPSTTDYNGIYKGRYIDFEAKETMSKTAFSLSNIHKHQLDHLSSIYRHKGIGFVIVRFNSLSETYLLEIEKMNDFLANNIRKSIPITFFKEKGYLIKDSFNPRIDYLKIVDLIIKENENEK